METMIAHALLPHTVRFAKERNPFYADLYADIDVSGIRTAEDLIALPAVSKAQLVAAENFLSMGEAPISTYNSSGTTGSFGVFYRTRAEQVFNHDFHVALGQELPCVEDENSLTLRLHAPGHGDVLILPRRSPAVLHCVVDPTTASNTASLLQHRFAFPGRPYVTRIAGSTRQLYWLTAYLIHHKIDPARLHVRELAAGGDYVPQRARRYLEKVWDASLELTWSQSELLGSGRLIDATRDWYRFEHTFVAEIVSPFDARISARCGALLATTLYPFVQCQPLIRYRTGDAFEYDPHTQMHRFLGRERQCLFFDNVKELPVLAISGTSVQEVIGGCPFAHRPTSVPMLPGVETADETSLSVFDCHYAENGGGTRVASIVVEVAPSSRQTHRRHLREEARRLLTRLDELNPQLCDCKSRFGLTVQLLFVESGSLSSPGASSFGKVRGFWDADLDLRALVSSVVARAELRDVA